jgi:sialate O-acetylesterase
MKRSFLFLISYFFFTLAEARVTLPQFFSDNMVLQQQSECNIWGWVEPGTRVCITTSWDKKGHNVQANKYGLFSLKVKTPKAGGPYFIGFKDKDYVQISNVMIGEVWICSGQSNMEMPMKGYKQQPLEGMTEELLNCKDTQLRLFTAKRHAALLPEKDVKGEWFEANTASVREFSATAYYFGRALRRQLEVPIGLIVTSWGGSACEAWMAPDWLKAFPKVNQHVTEEDMKKLQQRCPTALYYGQLKPLIGYTMRGAIWYQGEDNVPRYDFYAPLLARMVEGWRSDWKQGDFPFYYCQIAPFDYSTLQWSGSQYLREQQAKAEDLIPNARMAVLMDAGLEYGIHPRKKRQAGERLAVLALSNTYGVKGLPEFAKYKAVEFKGDTAVIAFDRSKEWVYFEHGTTSNNFEVAGSDHVFHPATKVWNSRNHVYVVCDQVKQPAAVRYAFKDWADGDLMHDGLPVSSFRTDDWEPTTSTATQSKGDYNNPK